MRYGILLLAAALAGCAVIFRNPLPRHDLKCFPWFMEPCHEIVDTK